MNSYTDDINQEPDRAPEPPVGDAQTGPSAGDPGSEADKSDSDPSFQHTRTGNVARLPKDVRDQLNYMLLDGIPFAKIIERLGEPAKELKEQHITRWKTHGGYEDWLEDLGRTDALRAIRDRAQDLVDQKAGVTVQDAGRALAAGQLYEFLRSFDPQTFATALKGKPELYLRIVDALCRLSEGEAVCGHRRAQESLIEAKLRPAQPGSGPNVIAGETLKEIAKQIKLV